MAVWKRILRTICDWRPIVFLPLSILLLLILIGCFNGLHPVIESPTIRVAIWVGANLFYLSLGSILSVWTDDREK